MRSMKRLALALCLLALAGCMKAAATGSAYNLGVQAYRIKDYASARQYWARAIDEHEIKAYNNLGYLLYYGLGGPQEVARAVSLWTEAAQAGERESQWHLGTVFETGKGRPKDLVEAYAWYRCAAEAVGDEEADDEIAASIAQDAKLSLNKLLPKLSSTDLAAGVEKATQYIGKYASRAHLQASAAG